MKKLISILITLILIGIVLFSGFKVEQKLNEYRHEKDKKTSISLGVRKGRDVDFDELLSMNEDVKGWIYLPDTEIDYPIVQGEDNDYYLHRGLDRKYLFEGTIFIDGACANPFYDTNTVIYGHHMFSGSMFCALEKYADKDFFDAHKIIQIETPEKSYDLHVIAYCNEPSDSELYTDAFAATETAGRMTVKDFIKLIEDKAINTSDEQFDESDKFVTLSTCAYNYNNARTQVIGVLRPAGMEKKTTVTEIDKPFVNKWLLYQIAVGLVMALAVIFALMGLKPSKK